MPHKHKRRQKDADTYDLPPTRIAKSLPVRDPASANNKTQKTGGPKNHNRKKPGGAPRKEQPQKATKQTPKDAAAALAATSRAKSAFDDDDTPRAFRRLMQRQQSQAQAAAAAKRNKNHGDSDDDDDNDGEDVVPTSKSNKKRKRGEGDAGGNNQKNKKKVATATAPEAESTDAMTTAAAAAAAAAAPKIMPGEKLSDFAARVNREMPLSAMKRSNKPAAAELANIREHKVTKHEKHLLRLQAMWRKEEAEIVEKERAQREEREEEMDEQLQLWKTWEAEAGKRKAKKKGSGNKKRKDGTADMVDDDPDPWAKLNKRERVNKQLNPLDVVQAPPQLTKPREVFKIRGGARVDVANVPAAVGSLRRREELATERRNIVEEYRRLMAEKRKAA
ncbi:hypothetical protein ASPACDRAFT_1858574 [Aspergillus aculeatus ATCC 16872]|uniref:Urease accessory protein UreD n=1 Tax=Aspergillus aculeatus (strain ATCC 16872 / CBS 172.66 / WB 5094) TaxID=690307 RepID=A0A1L9WLR7_ASPA1|nr:uncharacterized protein ASPACDRAFT_1858574 [Aspergillus aculeatus ATCC 16872]OJJ97112.1 hypothetical protein ASPACDRAFT_1858574 [Aspergillus aculeatus ATCC 16872]